MNPQHPSARPEPAKKRPKYLLTQSLLGSWLYVYNAFEKYEDAAYEDFVTVLNREDRPQTEAMLSGINFENQVVSAAKGANIEDPCVNAIADIVRGGQFQVALYRDKCIGDIDFLLYGKLDTLKAGIIYDIKWSKSYETGKYVKSIQHPFYFELCPEARRFEYLITDGQDVFNEGYDRMDTPGIDTTVNDFMRFLADCGLQQVYFEKWRARD